MGRRCAWCETVLPSHGGVWSPASDSICRGCFEELEIALAQTGLRFGQRTSEASRGAEAPVVAATSSLPMPTAT